MKKKRLIIIGCLVVLVAAYVVGMIPNIRFHREVNRTVEALRTLPLERVGPAVQAYVHDRKTNTAALPATVTFAELVSRGYLHTNDVAAFGGKHGEVSLDADESHPAAVYIRVHLPGGRDVVENTDGSIMLEPKL